MAVDRVEIPRSREAMPALQRDPALSLRPQAERRFRPFARRRLRIARPARVDIRARNPCRRFLRRTFGWKVRFTELREEDGWWRTEPAGHRPSIEKATSPNRRLRDGPPRLRDGRRRQFRKIRPARNPQARTRMAHGFAPPFHSCGESCGEPENACSEALFYTESPVFSSVERVRERCYDRRSPESGGGSSNQACSVLLN